MLPQQQYMLLTYRVGKCIANCGFCPQARTSQSLLDMLARVTWPAFSTKIIVEKIVLSAARGDVKRVCIQALNYPSNYYDILSLVRTIHSRSQVPISVSFPLSKVQMNQLAKEGTKRIGVALDAAT